MEFPWQERPLLVGNGSVAYVDNSSCFSSTQSTVLKGVSFGGVPVVLLIDFTVFLVLLLLFSAIRGKLWDYGRLALVSDSEGFNEMSHRRYGRTLSSGEESEHERGFCSWLPFIIRMDEDKVKARCGIDAVHYLSFQRHLIILMVLITITSVSVILPVNMSGDLLGNDPYSFGRTTVGNLQKGNNLLWLHTVFAVLYLILTVALLRRHTSQMKGMRRETARTTLFVRPVPKEASDQDIKTHFSEAYPTCRVADVHLSYDVAKLMHLDKERKRAEKNLRYYERELERRGRREVINPRLCGLLCCCTTRHCEEVDAIDFYSQQQESLQEQVQTQRELVPQRPLGMAFVTLQSEAMATYILRDFNALACGGGASEGSVRCVCGWEPQPSSVSPALKVKQWRVQYAPNPRNVYCLLSLAVFFRWLFDKEFLLDGKLRFECVFLPDQGAFFVNYVIAAGLVGSGMELLRLPGLLLYTIRMMLARSAAERKYVTQNQAYECEYGSMYGWTLCVFSVIMAYSIICPVIVPFGLLYLLLRHLVDKHNLYYAFLPARLDRQVHLGAVNQALAAPIICLIWLYFFSVLRTGFMADTSLFTLVVMCITIFICIGYTCFGHFKYLSPHNYVVKEEEDAEGLQENSMPYLPRVLYNTPAASPEGGRSYPSYGSTEGSPAHTSPLDDNPLES
ncbi:LOW QUALITY PROTEIN: CSC1-like protein 1 [Hypomesus transpacificus]|uniref:LOW QUALITY PROTEIN: CSC1-like protein 1 n=1 Tax=Hypomesus transpacificus TaxID=137520 RepID=UPI001F07E0E8|nr:LOW QUALITY PROTEIN: CSC1-like protein 1 [Hypomesus transpacificus]